MGEKTQAPLSPHLPSLLYLSLSLCVCTQLGSSKITNQALRNVPAQISEKTQKAECD